MVALRISTVTCCGVALLVAVLSGVAVQLSGCQSTVMLPGSNAPAVVDVVFRFSANDQIQYSTYTFHWFGDWVADNAEVTDSSLMTHADETMVLAQNDLYVSHVASFPPEGSLRGGHWVLALTVFGGQDKLGEWHCLPADALPYLPPGQTTIVTFQQNPDGSVNCTTEPGA